MCVCVPSSPVPPSFISSILIFLLVALRKDAVFQAVASAHFMFLLSSLMFLFGESAFHCPLVLITD